MWVWNLVPPTPTRFENSIYLQSGILKNAVVKKAFIVGSMTAEFFMEKKTFERLSKANFPVIDSW
jgi:hypothetical protein